MGKNLRLETPNPTRLGRRGTLRLPSVSIAKTDYTGRVFAVNGSDSGRKYRIDVCCFEKYDYTKVITASFNLRVMVDQRGNYKIHRSAVKRNSSSGSTLRKNINGCKSSKRTAAGIREEEAKPGEIAKKLGDRDRRRKRKIFFLYSEIKYL